MLTKRGAAAKAYLEKLCTVPADQITIGDRVAATGITNSGQTFNFVGTVIDIKSRKAVRTIERKLRSDSNTIDVSHKTEYGESQGFSISASSGSTTTFPGCKNWNDGATGTTIEEFTEYYFTISGKHGTQGTTADKFRVYRANNEELIRQAIAYQDTLTKTGTVRKGKK